MVERRQERREGLTRAGWRHDERILTRGDGRPAQSLRWRRLAKLLAKPGRDRRVKSVQNVRDSACFCHGFPKDLARRASFPSRMRPSIVAQSVTAIKTDSIQSSTERLTTYPTSELTGDRKREGEMTFLGK
jgi:hypothetical protein